MFTKVTLLRMCLLKPFVISSYVSEYFVYTCLMDTWYTQLPSNIDGYAGIFSVKRVKLARPGESLFASLG